MEEIEFIFQVTDLNEEVLVPQISKALEKRTELRSRQTAPKMWNATDKLNESNKMTEEEKKRRRMRKKILGVLFMILGVILFVPGLVKRDGNMMALIVGAIAIIVGFNNFRTSGEVKRNSEKFDNAAREFLTGHKESLKNNKVQICFSGEEMITVMGELDELDQDAVSFDQIEYVMETEDIFFAIYQGRGIVLQKKDLDQELGTLDEFRVFVNKNVKKIIDLTEE